MAALAIRECQIAAEGPFPIVTTQAALPAAGRKVFRGGRRSYLPALGQTGGQRVTGGTFQTLSWTMFGMTEAQAERARIRRGARKGARLMADATRSNVVTAGRLTRGCMATVTLGMRRQAYGNRQSCAAVQGLVVTGSTTIPRPRRSVHVLGMIEAYVEAFFEVSRKSLYWRRPTFHIHVTDGAHRHRRRDKLGQVTVGTGWMIGKRGFD